MKKYITIFTLLLTVFALNVNANDVAAQPSKFIVDVENDTPHTLEVILQYAIPAGYKGDLGNLGTPIFYGSKSRMLIIEVQPGLSYEHDYDLKFHTFVVNIVNTSTKKDWTMWRSDFSGERCDAVTSDGKYLNKDVKAAFRGVTGEFCFTSESLTVKVKENKEEL